MKKTIALLLTLCAILALAIGAAAQEAPSDGLALVPGGTFSMGSPEDEPWRGADEALHIVSVSDFYLGVYEVTQAEYQALMGANPSTFPGDDLPVEGLTWYEAIAYLNALSAQAGLAPAYVIENGNVIWDRGADGYRLPTEAEWEYACRAGTATPFNTQTSISVDEANYWGHYPYQIEENYFNQENLQTRPGIYREETVPVGSFAPNGFGLYDMHGNVAEWVWDYYGDYPLDAQADPTGPDAGTRRVYRGGAWNDFAKNLRSAYRATAPAENASFAIGLRVARNAAAHSGQVATAGASDERAPQQGRTLIAYFSWGGNTQGIAREIQRQTGFDLFEITCATPYSDDYSTVLEQAQADQNIQARPPLASHVDDMAQYDTIILGYPNWWASIPMPVASFLEEYDFSGKTILPFCSHGGGRFGQSLTAIAKLAPEVTLLEGLAVSYSGGAGLGDDVAQWLNDSGVLP